MPTVTHDLRWYVGWTHRALAVVSQPRVTARPGRKTWPGWKNRRCRPPRSAWPRSSCASRRWVAWNKSRDNCLGSGPTTGLIVSEDGYILSSAFGFVGKPSSILVTLPSGTRTSATIVAHDSSRMLVLLKAATDEKAGAVGRAARSAAGRAMDAGGRSHLSRFVPQCLGGHPQCHESDLGKSGADRRQDIAQQLRRTADRHPRQRDRHSGPALAATRRARWPVPNGTTRESASPCRWPTSCRGSRP